LEFLYLKNEPQRAQSFPQRAQSFKIYLCVTLRFTLRSLRLNKKVNLNCVTHNLGLNYYDVQPLIFVIKNICRF